ncbi:MAG: protease modulator HflC, partial [Desulfovibrionales bacterium]|nr:protease modulator HflC [Desulfovibrionales bacterium]
MNPSKAPLIIITLIIAVLLGTQCFFTVDETQRAILLQLGKPVKSDIQPGLHFKLPLIQNVVFFDSRVLEYDAKQAEVITLDKKNLIVDNYAKWRISDNLLFYQSVRTIERAVSRLEDIIYAELRVDLGQYALTDIVSTKRNVIMEQVTMKSNEILNEFGIEVLDVRIKRTDLPRENMNAIFGRMQAERQRQAREYRSMGHEQAQRITTSAERERDIILAEAQQKASKIRGEGEAEAISLYAASLGQN